VISYELNGMPREAVVADKSIAPKSKARVKADPADPLQLGAPIPGMVTALSATLGGKVAKGEKARHARSHEDADDALRPADGVTAEVAVAVGDSLGRATWC